MGLLNKLAFVICISVMPLSGQSTLETGSGGGKEPPFVTSEQSII